METVHTPLGNITYVLQRKRVKNINLRIGPGGEVSVSAPKATPKAAIDAFISAKANWIMRSRQKVLARVPAPPCPYTAEECLALFTRVSDEIFPLFQDVLKGKKPLIIVKNSKSRWGVCYPQKNTLIFSTMLAAKPMEAIEYVILHEYVHFLHPDHQAGFHAEMTRLMPDYRQRRKLLCQPG